MPNIKHLNRYILCLGYLLRFSFRTQLFLVSIQSEQLWSYLIPTLHRLKATNQRVDGHLHARTLRISRNKSRLLHNEVIGRIIKDLNAHRNHMQNSPLASQWLCKINFQSTVQKYMGITITRIVKKRLTTSPMCEFI